MEGSISCGWSGPMPIEGHVQTKTTAALLLFSMRMTVCVHCKISLCVCVCVFFSVWKNNPNVNLPLKLYCSWCLSICIGRGSHFQSCLVWLLTQTHIVTIHTSVWFYKTHTHMHTLRGTPAAPTFCPSGRCGFAKTQAAQTISDLPLDVIVQSRKKDERERRDFINTRIKIFSTWIALRNEPFF